MGLFDFLKSNTFVDDKSLSNLVYTFKLIDEFKQEDSDNFIGLSIFGLDDNDDVVIFKNATKVFFKVIYSATSVASTWQKYPDYPKYLNYRSWFNMFEENDGSYSFCCKKNLGGGNAVLTLNSAFAQAGISKSVTDKEKSIYISLL